MRISAIINTLNEEKNLERCLKSVRQLADEIVVCDDGSSDKTVEIAQRFKAKVFHHQSKGFVEPARNFAISKATNDWILIIDADEEIPKTLASKLRELAISHKPLAISNVLIPRKNIIFGKWIKHSGWWPDYNVRFFKKGSVIFSDKIHHDPKAMGEGLKLPEKEENAIIHHNYDSINQFIDRLNNYTTIEAKQLADLGYKFSWKDLVEKPFSEFLARFFAQKGYKDGLHGFALAALQAFSFFVVYLKVWEIMGFKEEKLEVDQIEDEFKKKNKELKFWLNKSSKKKLSKFPRRFFQ